MAEISVIVPVYNVEQFIRTCIESILDQTFIDIEVIIVDDGSPDNSGRICDEYMEKDKRVRVIHQENIGLSGARNRGIKAAKGRYICFVDSDDYIIPEFCEIMYKMLETSKCDFCACRYQKFQYDEELLCREKLNVEEYSISNYEYLNKQITFGFSACAKLYRREIFNTNKFCNGKIHEDIIWSADLAKSLHNGVCCTESKLYYYRQNDAGIMAASSVKCSPDRVYAGNYLLDIVKQSFPDMIPQAFKYGIMFPWSYVDGIFVHRTFNENRLFLKEMQNVLRHNRNLLKNNRVNESKINRHRMIVFSYSLILYGCNAYVRLFRLYFYKIIQKDAYKSGHGI